MFSPLRKVLGVVITYHILHYIYLFRIADVTLKSSMCLIPRIIHDIPHTERWDTAVLHVPVFTVPSHLIQLMMRSIITEVLLYVSTGKMIDSVAFPE